MLSIHFIRENKEFIIERLKIRNFNNPDIIEQIISLDEKRRNTQKLADQSLSEMNTISKEIGLLYQSGKREEAEQKKARTGKLKEEIKSLNTSLANYSNELDDLIVQVPNIPHISVPKGIGAEDNVIVKENLNIPELKDNSLPHWDLGIKFDILDFELGNKITGAGFPVFKAKGATLERALINFFLDENIKAGYTEISPPILVNEASAFGTGQLPDKEGQMYHVTGDNMYLIPTAEVPVTNLYRDMILNEDQLPIKNTSYTPCFRREAGSYGKDVRGLNRVHQFDKVEIVQIQHPDNSYNALEEMVLHVEKIINKLELPYRIVRLCGGDMGFTSALTYDFEVFAAAQKKWLEVSSVSNFEGFQANRLKLRFRDKTDKKIRTAHTLNGSSLALPRIVAALMENNQSDHGIKIPEALQAYTGFNMIS